MRSAPSSTAAMFFIARGDWQLALALFVITNVGVAGSIVFYDSLLPHIVARRRARSGVDGGLRARISRRRRAARDQHRDDGEPVVVRAVRTVTPRCAPASPASRCGGCCSRFRCSGRFPSRARSSATTARPGTSIAAAFRQLLETLRELRRYRAGVPAAARVPDLQRRHPDDHPDGDDLRHGDRDRRERDDRRAADHAVHRRAVRVPVRGVRGKDRRASARCSSASRSIRSSPSSATSCGRRRTSSRSASWWAWCRAARRRSADRSSRA